MPYIISGLLEPVDAIFETMSGFTTTGASVINDVESMGYGIKFWRSLSQWLGGFGILMLIVAFIPSLKENSLGFFRAETTGQKKKVKPSVFHTIREILAIYAFFTLVQTVLLKMAGLSWFESLVHTFATVATGGFSVKNGSIGAYNNILVEAVVILFIVICGMNSGLHRFLLRGNFLVLKDPESRVFIAFIFTTTTLIVLNLVQSMGYETGKAIRYSVFQVVSIITGTGFSTQDFDKWPHMSRAILLFLMIVGGCTGSTTGALKVYRLIILAKGIKQQFMNFYHPKAVIPIRVGQTVISREVFESVQSFFFLILMISAFSVIILTALGMDLISSVSAVFATIGIVGPGLGMVGPALSYSAIPEAAKILLTFLMLIGRLEIYTVMVVVTRNLMRY